MSDLSRYSAAFLRDAAKNAAKTEAKTKKAEVRRRAYEAKRDKKWAEERLEREAHVRKLFTDLGLIVDYTEESNCIVINGTIAISAQGGDGTTYLDVGEINVRSK